MSLVQGYDSPSSDEDVISRENKRTKRSKSDLKVNRQKRKGKGPWAKWESSSDEEEFESTNSYLTYKLDLGNDEQVASSTNEKSSFFGKNEKDYQGRGILFPPIDVDVDFKRESSSIQCFLPKQKIYEYPGHKSGCTTLRFIPGSGHLLLSGGNDTIINIWDFYHDRELLRSYEGHSMTIKNVNFDPDGTTFASASYDKWVKIWNTEDGTVSSRLRFSSVPNCITFNPTDKNQLVVGLSNSEIRHYDLRVSEKNGLIQTYDHHQGSILALKYFPDGTKLISSSEDKTVRIWENQINIPIKQISDTAQHSMPWIDVNPTSKYFSTQSMDNTIYTYSMTPKYKRNNKKTFKGCLLYTSRCV